MLCVACWQFVLSKTILHKKYNYMPNALRIVSVLYKQLVYNYICMHLRYNRSSNQVSCFYRGMINIKFNHGIYRKNDA